MTAEQPKDAVRFDVQKALYHVEIVSSHVIKMYAPKRCNAVHHHVARMCENRVDSSRTRTRASDEVSGHLIRPRTDHASLSRIARVTAGFAPPLRHHEEYGRLARR